MAREYAATTKVTVTKTRQDIENIVLKYGAAQFLTGIEQDRAVIGFTIEGRQIRFVLPLGDLGSEQKQKARWRSLFLVVKAKLEAVAAGISTFENEFMANIVMPDGRLVSDHAAPMIAKAYENGAIAPLLPDFSDQ